jgi:serine/threonine protein kinase
MVFEYMPHGALQSYIANQKQIDWTERYQIFLDICVGVTYLHSATDQDGNTKIRMVHQELTSGNVFVSKEGGTMRAKISDFGLSSMKNYSVEIGAASAAKEYRDTSCYIAPERLVKGCKYTVKCDVFSMGILLLELVSLRPPTNIRKILPKILELNLPAALRQCIDVTMVYSLLLNRKAEHPGERAIASELVEILTGTDGLQIKDMDNSIKTGQFNDIGKEVQDILQDLFSVRRERKPEELKPSPLRDTSEAPPPKVQTESATKIDSVVVPSPITQSIITPIKDSSEPSLAETPVKSPDVSKDKLVPSKEKGAMAKMFSSKKEKAITSGGSGANGSQSSLKNIFNSFDNKTSKLKMDKKLQSGSFGEVWKATLKDRDVVMKKLFRDNGFSILFY